MRCLIGILSSTLNRWIARQYKTFYHLAEPLSAEEKAAFLPYFSSQVLDRSRKIFLSEIRPPCIRGRIRLSILKTFFWLRGLKGLTLIHCVFLGSRLGERPSRPVRSILFHELVHVTQYEVLGSKEFILRYIQSWIRHHFSYEQISFERIAYTLTHHYEMFPGEPFSVEERVLEGLTIK